MTPADYRLRVGEEDIVHLIFAGKEVLRICAGSAGILDRGAAQFVHIATRTKGFFTGTVNVDRRYRVIFSPLEKLGEHNFDHLGIERVQNSGHIEREAANAFVALSNGGNNYYAVCYFCH